MQTSEAVIITYSPNYRHKYGFFKTWGMMIKNIIDSRELIYQLFKRDFLHQYKKSFLGQGWLIIAPLIGVVSWMILNSTGVLNPGEVGVPFPVYVLISSSIWGLFMSFYQAAEGTLKAGHGFINQINFPHDVLLIKQVAQQLANFSLGFILNIIILVIYGITIPWQIIFFPLAILPMFFLGAGIGLFVSMVSVVATDISRVTTTLLGFVFYITPVIFSPAAKSETLQKIVAINPLSYLIDVPRDLVIFGTVENLETFLAIGLACFVFFMISWRLFFVSENSLIEKIN